MKSNCKIYPYLCSTAACILILLIENSTLCEGFNTADPEVLHFWIENNNIILDPVSEQFMNLGEYKCLFYHTSKFVPDVIRTHYNPNPIIFLNNLKKYKLHDKLIYW